MDTSNEDEGIFLAKRFLKKGKELEVEGSFTAFLQDDWDELEKNYEKRFALVNAKGELITGYIFNDYIWNGISITIYSQDLSRILVKSRIGWEYINRNGEHVILANQYQERYHFSLNRALVKKDGKYGYIDEYGEVVIPFIYTYASDFEGDYAEVSIGNSEEFFIQRDGQRIYGIPSRNKERLISKEGIERIELVYRNGVVYKGIKGYIDLGSEYANVYVDLDGELVGGVRNGTHFYNGHAFIVNEEAVHLINTRGEALLRTCFESIGFHDPNSNVVNVNYPGEVRIEIEKWYDDGDVELVSGGRYISYYKGDVFLDYSGAIIWPTGEELEILKIDLWHGKDVDYSAQYNDEKHVYCNVKYTETEMKKYIYDGGDRKFRGAVDLIIMYLEDKRVATDFNKAQLLLREYIIKKWKLNDLFFLIADAQRYQENKEETYRWNKNGLKSDLPSNELILDMIRCIERECNKYYKEANMYTHEDIMGRLKSLK